MWKTHVIVQTNSYVITRCHLETFQALSTNLGDNPRITKKVDQIINSEMNCR